LDSGAPWQEREKTFSGSLQDWDAAWAFLKTIRSGRLRSAAARLTLSINMVCLRRFDFKPLIGATWFKRGVRGTGLTASGFSVVSTVERMEAASFDLIRSGDGVTRTGFGKARLTATGGLARVWSASHEVQQQALRNLRVGLKGKMRSAEMTRHAAQAVPRLAQQPATRLNLSWLGRMHRMLFASRQYIATYGVLGLWKSCASISLSPNNSPTPAMSSQPSKTGFPVVRRGINW
jgi:hypothetical protein